MLMERNKTCPAHTLDTYELPQSYFLKNGIKDIFFFNLSIVCLFANAAIVPPIRPFARLPLVPLSQLNRLWKLYSSLITFVF